MNPSAATPLLSRTEEIELAINLEVGIFAARLLAELSSDGAQPASKASADQLAGGSPGRLNQASATELQLLVELGQQARERLYLANLGLVGSLVEQWAARTGLPAHELYQEGCVGLGETIRAFDWRRGVRFSTLAWKRINYAILAAAATRCGEIDAPLSQARAALRLQQDWQRREAEHGAELSLAAYASEAGLAATKVVSLMRVRGTTSFDEATHDVAAPISEPTFYPGWDAELSGDERRVIALKYLTDPQPTMAALASQTGMTKTKLRRVEQRALAKLKVTLQAAA